MRVVWIFWLVFSIIFFGGAALWQNRSSIVSSLVKKQVENKVKDLVSDELKQIINLEKELIEGGGLKYNPPSLDLFNREDRLLLDTLTLPTGVEEEQYQSPIEYLLPENLKEKYKNIFKSDPRFEYPSFGPNTIFEDPYFGIMKVNQQIDAGPFVVSINGSWNNPTVNIIPDYNFPIKVTYQGAFREEGLANNVTLTYNEQLYDNLYFTSSVLYGDEIGMNLGVNYKQGYVNIQQTEHLSLNGGYKSQF
jgi:hypothetical protein